MSNNINVITQKKELYDKCENMEELYDKYYLPLLEKHYKKTYILEQALYEIEKYIENHKRESELHIYGLAIPKFVFDGDIEDIKEIIQKAKGDVKNENNNI
jgi:hypothetical protein